MLSEDFNRACALLPEGVNWGDNLTPELALRIAGGALRPQADAGQWNGFTTDEKDHFVGSLVEHGTEFVAPLYAVVDNIEKALMEKNRAQADAQPAGWRDEAAALHAAWASETMPAAGTELGKRTATFIADCIARANTHPAPEAAQALSELALDNLIDDCLKITEGTRHPFGKDTSTWADMRRVVDLILTRASAATAVEPSIQHAPGDWWDEAASLHAAWSSQTMPVAGTELGKRTADFIGDCIARAEAAQQAAPVADEEIHVNVSGGDVYTLPLQASGMDSPRFVAHVPASNEVAAQQKDEQEAFRAYNPLGYKMMDGQSVWQAACAWQRSQQAEPLWGRKGNVRHDAVDRFAKAREQMRQIEKEHDAKSEFQREVENMGQRPGPEEGEILRLHTEMAGLRQMLDAANARADQAVALSNHLQDKLVSQQAEPVGDERAALELWRKYACQGEKLESTPYHAARAAMGTNTELQDKGLYLAIQAYLRAAQSGQRAPGELPPIPPNVVQVTRRIRRCEGDVAAQVVLEHFAMEYARAAMAGQRAGVAEGWCFYSADFSMNASNPANWGTVMLTRDDAGRKWWHALSDEEREKIDLFVSGRGTTFDAAMKAANEKAAIAAAPTPAAQGGDGE